MSIFIRFFDADTNTVLSDATPESIKISWKLNQSPEWSAGYPKNTLAMKNIQKGNLIEIYKDGGLLLQGILQDFGEKWNNDTIELSISGRGRLDGLYDVRAYSQAYFLNKELLSILTQLLNRAGWRVGQIKTLVNPTQTLTIDLRSEKRLLAQVSSLLLGIPGTFFRYGGLVAGKQSIDIGSFGEESGVGLYKTNPMLLDELTRDFGEQTGIIEKIDVKQALAEIINSVEVIGGDVKDNTGVTRAITLKDALTADPTLATNPNFPIVTEIANFVYYIRNNAVAITRGSQSTERYTQYTPEKETGNATLAACNSAGLALYNRGVSFLTDHADDVTEYSVDAVGEDLYVNVGDTIYVKTNVRQPVIDPFSDEIAEYIDSEVDADLRTTQVSLDMGDDKAEWSFDLSDQAILTQEDIFVSVYDETKRDQPPAGAAYAPAFAPSFATLSASQSGGNADTTLSDGTPAKLVTLSLPAAPGGSTDVLLAGIPYGTSPNGTIVTELVSDPVFAGLVGPTIAVAVKFAGWINAYSASLTGYIVWI